MRSWNFAQVAVSVLCLGLAFAAAGPIHGSLESLAIGEMAEIAGSGWSARQAVTCIGGAVGIAAVGTLGAGFGGALVWSIGVHVWALSCI